MNTFEQLFQKIADIIVIADIADDVKQQLIGEFVAYVLLRTWSLSALLPSFDLSLKKCCIWIAFECYSISW